MQLFIYFLSLGGFFPCRVMGWLLEPVSAAYEPGRVYPWMRSQLHHIFTHWGHEQEMSEGVTETRTVNMCVSAVCFHAAQRQWHQGQPHSGPSHWEINESSTLLFTAVSNIITLCCSHSSRQLLWLRNQISVKNSNFTDMNRFKSFLILLVIWNISIDINIIDIIK